MLVKVALTMPYFSPLLYTVSKPLQPQAAIGCFALVPIKNTTATGLIVALISDKAVISKLSGELKLRDVISINPPVLKLAHAYLNFISFVADYYLCSLGEVLKSALPGIMWPKADDFSGGANFDKFLARQTQLLDQAGTYLAKVSTLPLANIQFKPFNFRLTWQQKQVLAYIKKSIDLGKQFTKAKLSDNSHSLNDVTLLDLKAPFLNIYAQDKKNPTLNRTPTLNRLLNKQNRLKPFLLWGITGSGKTEIYIKACQYALSHQKSVILLLPEIALTPQTLARFTEYLKFTIAKSPNSKDVTYQDFNPLIVYHSKLTPKQRRLAFATCLNSHTVVVIGTRSAIFLPVNNLGLVIVDEEHDKSFKQQERPFYNARDLSLKLALQHGAAAVLGSATPSIESFYNVTRQRYFQLRLTHRPLGANLPKLTAIDLKEALASKKFFYLSQIAYQAIVDTLADGGQVLVFLNLRGFARFLVCKKCQEPVFCKNCDIALTWHITKKKLICHNCNYQLAFVKNCPRCNFDQLRFEGFGSQRLEIDFKNHFNTAQVIRVDADSVNSFAEMRQVFSDIAAKKYDIIIGTQMLTKGHDFAHVKLVIVPLADISLNMPDFRAAERTFQTIYQVSGRAGRGQNFHSQAILQSYNRHHPAISCALAGDFTTFAAYELDKRAKLLYPPFCKIAHITVNDTDEARVTAVALHLFDYLNHQLPAQIKLLPPIKAPIYLKNKRFEWEIEVKSSLAWHLNQFLKAKFWHNKAQKIISNSRLLIKIDV